MSVASAISLKLGVNDQQKPVLFLIANIPIPSIVDYIFQLSRIISTIMDSYSYTSAMMQIQEEI